MIIPAHAQREMALSGITEEEVRSCVGHGNLEIRQVVRGEVRYGKKLELKDKTVVAIYTLRHNEERVVTAYLIRRRSPWQKP